MVMPQLTGKLTKGVFLAFTLGVRCGGGETFR